MKNNKNRNINPFLYFFVRKTFKKLKAKKGGKYYHRRRRDISRDEDLLKMSYNLGSFLFRPGFNIFFFN